MKNICIGSLLLLLAVNAQARNLNYIESSLFRLSSYNRSEEWIQPFYRYHKNSFPNYQLSFFGSTHPEVKGLIDDIGSKDDDLIQKRIDDSYGKPYDASAKVQFLYRNERFIQTFSINAGAVAVVNDPVFPELSGIFFQDYIGTSSYIFKVNKELVFIPRIIYGKRRVLDTSLTVAELVDRKPDTKIKNQPWNTVVDISLSARYEFESFDLLGELNSLPLSNNEYNYWDTNLGIKSKNLKDFFSFDTLKRIDCYFSYSPIYGGDYDVSRTVKFGMGVEFSENFMIDIFSHDKFSFGSILKFNDDYYAISIFTHENSYDDYQEQRSRKYGLNFAIQY